MFISSNIPPIQKTDYPGDNGDLDLLDQDRWLMDTEVIPRLIEKSGLWYLTMVYVAVDNPFKFICRRIDVYNSVKKANTFASILQRGIRKDARGTLKSNRDAFDLCNN